MLPYLLWVGDGMNRGHNMDNKLEQLKRKEVQLLEQIICITQWSGSMFCALQRQELKQVREQIATLKDN